MKYDTTDQNTQKKDLMIINKKKKMKTISSNTKSGGDHQIQYHRLTIIH